MDVGGGGGGEGVGRYGVDGVRATRRGEGIGAEGFFLFFVVASSRALPAAVVDGAIDRMVLFVPSHLLGGGDA